jgi:hypothetical protein
MQEITGAIFAITLVMTAVFIRNEILARSGAYPPFVSIGADAAPDEHSLYTLAGAVEQHLNVVPGSPFPTPLPNEWEPSTSHGCWTSGGNTGKPGTRPRGAPGRL